MSRPLTSDPFIQPKQTKTTNFKITQPSLRKKSLFLPKGAKSWDSCPEAAPGSHWVTHLICGTDREGGVGPLAENETPQGAEWR